MLAFSISLSIIVGVDKTCILYLELLSENEDFFSEGCRLIHIKPISRAHSNRIRTFPCALN